MSYCRQPLSLEQRKTVLKMIDNMLDFSSFILMDMLNMPYDKELSTHIQRVIDTIDISTEELEKILKRR